MEPGCPSIAFRDYHGPPDKMMDSASLWLLNQFSAFMGKRLYMYMDGQQRYKCMNFLELLASSANFEALKNQQYQEDEHQNAGISIRSRFRCWGSRRSRISITSIRSR